MKKRIAYVDILRILAIISIVLFHFLYDIYPSTALRYMGFFGVSLFFIISGFVLAQNYPKLISFSAKWFAKRYVKIAIIYLLAMLTIAFLFGKQSYPGDLYANILVHLTFLDAFFPQFAYSLISPAWFLVPLVCLYLVFPYLNRLIKKDARLLVIPFIIMAVARMSDRTLTSYSPLFFIGEFCFGMAFAYGKKNLALLVSLMTVLIDPMMFLTFAVFYAFSLFDFKVFERNKVFDIIAANTIAIFLFHEAFINIIIGRWTIYGMNIPVELTIFLASVVAAVYISQKVDNYILSRRILKLN